MADWDQIYQNEGPVQTKPSEQIITLVPLFQKEGVRRILDHGCGTGRHTKYLACQGFYVVGTDYSETALLYARELTSGMNNVELVQSDMDSIPYAAGYFDATVSNHTIQHSAKEQRDGAFQEIERTLRPKGLLFLRTVSRMHMACGTGRQIEPYTFVDMPDMPDGATPHHYFSEEEIRGYMERFKVLSLEHRSLPSSEFFKLGVEEWVVLARKN